MKHSVKVSLAGLFIGLLAVLNHSDTLVLGSFIILAASCICHAIEAHSKENEVKDE